MRENTLRLNGSPGAGTDVDERAVDRGRAKEDVKRDLRADGVDDEVEPTGEVLEGVGVGRRVVVVRAESQPVLLPLERLRQHGDLGAHRVGELDGHVPEPAEGPRRHCGASQVSSAAGSHPHTDTSD